MAPLMEMPGFVQAGRCTLLLENSPPHGSRRRNFIHGERLAYDTLHNQTAADALGTDADLGGCFAGLHPEGLQVWAEPAFGDTGRLTTVTAKVLRLTAFDLRVTSNRLLSTN